MTGPGLERTPATVPAVVTLGVHALVDPAPGGLQWGVSHPLAALVSSVAFGDAAGAAGAGEGTSGVVNSP